MSQITVVGGGLAGLTAAIACAEEGAEVRLLEAHEQLGGRARSADGPYKANLGPHALYNDGPFWDWLSERGLLPDHVRPPLDRRALPLRGLACGARRRWARSPRCCACVAARRRSMPTSAAGRAATPTSASPRCSSVDRRRLHLPPRPRRALRGVRVGAHGAPVLSRRRPHDRALRQSAAGARWWRRWSAACASWAWRCRPGSRVEALPEAPVILATELAPGARAARRRRCSGRAGSTVCLDLGLRRRRGDPVDRLRPRRGGLDRALLRRRSARSPRTGDELIQAQMPIRPGESTDQAGARLERLLDRQLADWRERETWRRRQVMDARSGALDLPGSTWRDRPAVDRGDGVYLAGDMVAAPGAARRGLLGQRPRGQPAGAGRGRHHPSAAARRWRERRSALSARSDSLMAG